MYIQANVCIVYSGSDHASYYEKRVKVNVFALASASLHAHIQRGHTIFTRIVAAATINFSLVPVRLLIEGGSYSRAALTTFHIHPYCARASTFLVIQHTFMRGYNERQ